MNEKIKKQAMELAQLHVDVATKLQEVPLVMDVPSHVLSVANTIVMMAQQCQTCGKPINPDDGE